MFGELESEDGPFPCFCYPIRRSPASCSPLSCILNYQRSCCQLNAPPSRLQKVAVVHPEHPLDLPKTPFLSPSFTVTVIANRDLALAHRGTLPAYGSYGPLLRRLQRFPASLGAHLVT